MGNHTVRTTTYTSWGRMFVVDVYCWEQKRVDLLTQLHYNLCLVAKVRTILCWAFAYHFYVKRNQSWNLTRIKLSSSWEVYFYSVTINTSVTLVVRNGLFSLQSISVRLTTDGLLLCRLWFRNAVGNPNQKKRTNYHLFPCYKLMYD